MEEDRYKNYVGGIVAGLQNYHPDSSFMVFNFREGNKRTRISRIMSKHNTTVMEYPRQYIGCPMLPLEMIYHFLQFSDSWMSLAGQQNVVLMHCERGGWPVIAFMLAALLLFRKQYNGEQKTLEMVYNQAPRELLHLLTPLNPQPSQLRYLQYISRRNLGSDWPPSDTPLALDCIMLRVLPTYGEKGCRPVVRIYGQDSSSTTANRSSKLLFASSKTKKQACYYQPKEHELVKIDIHHRVQGDVVLECIRLDHVREEMMFRVMFHTTFVRGSVLMLSRDEVDVMWDARDQIPKNFKAEVLFSDADALPSVSTTGGEFEEFSEVEEIFSKAVDEQDAKVEPDTLLLKDNRLNVESEDIVFTAEEVNNKQDKEESPRKKLGKDDSQQKLSGNISWKKSIHVSYPPPRYGVPSPPAPPSPPPPSPRYGAPSPSAPDSDVSEGGRRKPTGSETEEVHMVLFPDADSLHESQKFWDEFWKKVDATFIEEKPSKLW